jgi:hypothetical protein
VLQRLFLRIAAQLSVVVGITTVKFEAVHPDTHKLVKY